MKPLPALAALLLLATAAHAADPTGAKLLPTPIFNAKELGATADGKTKDTAALQKALDDCAAKGGGTVLLPAGTYLTGSLLLGNNTTLHLAKDATLLGSPDKADYPTMNVRWEGEWREGHASLIRAKDVHDVAITGEGTIQGPPVALAALRPNNAGNVRGPSIFEPIEVKGLTLQGFTVKYQRMWSLHLTYCDNVLLKNVTVRSSQTNGDALDIDSCKNVLVDTCDLDGGDDAISLKSGRGMEAVEIGRPTENVTIRDCILASSGFAGLGIGTEMSGGVRNVSVERTTFARCNQNGVFLKSKTNRGGYIENISFTDCTFSAKSATVLGVDLVTKGIEASRPVTGDDRFPRVKNITFTNTKVEGVPVLILARNVAPERPLDGLTFSGLTGTAQKGITLTNMTNVKFEKVAITAPAPLFTVTNVTGEGFQNK